MKLTSKEIFGAEIQYFRLDPKYWESILIALKDTGLRTVTSYVPWELHSISEPTRRHPAGILDFEGKTNPRLNLLKFLDLIQKHDLNMNFRCGPFCCNEMDYGGLPQWLVLGDPNIMVWDYQNRPTQGYWIGKKEGSQPSYLHPEYLRLCRAWFTEVDKIILPRLKTNGGCITMINIDNEISYVVKDSFLDSDYNPINIKPGGFYHQFLQEKYGSIHNLPYREKYKNFEEILPPRHVPETLDHDFAYYADWLLFKTWVMTKFIEELRKIHEENGIREVLFMTNLNPHLPEGIPTRMPAFEKALGENGTVGYDFYRGVFMSYSGYHSMARILKLMNASLKYTWSPEFMSGTWMKNLGNTRVSDEHMRFMARCALAQGCKSINWFMFHDRDCWGDAPVSSQGHKRPSYEVLREIPEILFHRVRDWDRLRPQMDVGIVYDLIHHLHTGIGDPFICDDNNTYVGNPTIAGIPAGKASLEYYGLFRLIEQAGYQAGVIDILHNSELLHQFRVVFLPGSPITAEQTLKSLEDFVLNGGILIISGVLPQFNEKGIRVSFLGLKKAPKTKREFSIGKGKLIFIPYWIAQEKPEEEILAHITMVREIIQTFYGAPHVEIQPTYQVRWIDWKQGGGKQEYIQPRNLGSAILHSSSDEHLLFLLNHYIEAVNFNVYFGRMKVKQLIDLSTGQFFPVHNNRLNLDLDRKSASIYHVIPD